MKNMNRAYGICLYKIKRNDIEILLCKGVSSLTKWGCLKGVILNSESPKECAKREFLEECNIKVKFSDFEEYFEQKNDDKDIGIWLVNADKIKNFDEYFSEGKLLNTHLSWENAKVKFFSITEIPEIRKKQKYLISEVIDFLKNKNQSH